MINPEQEALLADSVGLALLMFLETLTPRERLAFVLHDIFAVPFEEIARVAVYHLRKLSQLRGWCEPLAHALRHGRSKVTER